MFHRFLRKSSTLTLKSFQSQKDIYNKFFCYYTTQNKNILNLLKAVNNEFHNHPRSNEAIDLINQEKIMNKDLLRRFLMSGKLEMPNEDEIRYFTEKFVQETKEKRELYQKVRDALGWVEFESLKSAVENALKTHKPSSTCSINENNIDTINEKDSILAYQQGKLHSSLRNIKISDRFQQARPLPTMINTQEQIEKAKLLTKGRIVTRFPPEPNGYLHLGHAKAMQLSFSVAEQENGYTILRMDDTNPENEQKEYVDSIINSVQWLGYKPELITHASDYFQEMYDLACKLILDGKAFVDFQDQKTIQNQRENMIESPYRSMKPEEAMIHFENMKHGKFNEGEAVLRLKIDMKHPLFVMRDMIAYRIKFAPHPQTGSTWKIYPTYDFTHCICDALENITYSLCTLEFENRRESYYWLLDALNLYKPHVWEFSRLNLTNTIVSKRKLQKLINKGIVKGWNDPRLITLEALKRRGYTPESIKNFCKAIGVTRNSQQISLKLLEYFGRLDLDEKAERRFAIVKPLQLYIDNFENVILDIKRNQNLINSNSLTQIEKISNKCIYLSVPNHPVNSTKGRRIMPLTKILYIESDDFRTKDLKSFFGLSLNKSVHLRYGFNIRCTHIEDSETGKIYYDENIDSLNSINSIAKPIVHVILDYSNSEKCKGNIHWISQNEIGQDPPKAEIRHYENLFLSENVPLESDEALLADVNPNSEIIFNESFVEWSIKDQKPDIYEKYQFERLGFYSVDTDSNKEKYVFNRVVPLKESKDKSILKNKI